MSTPMAEENRAEETALPVKISPSDDTPCEDVLPTGSEGATENTPAAPVSEEPKEEPPIDYARMAAEDLAEIKRLDPSYAPASHLGELPFAQRFAELRDMGLSVREALAAAAPRFDRTDGRSHLRAVAPRGGKAAPEGLAASDMKAARSLFYGLSDSEINALYRRVTQKHND